MYFHRVIFMGHFQIWLGIGKIGDFEQSNIGTYGCCLGIHEGRCGVRKDWKSFHGTD